MSLDVSLHIPGAPPRVSSGIFIRENGAIRELSRTEWDQRYPGRKSVIAKPDASDSTVFRANITHNLGQMASEAGIYQALWRPEEIGIAKAGQLVELLEAGLMLLRAERSRFVAFNPSNGWGDYDGLVDFVTRYHAACREYPDADVSVSR